MCWRVYILDNSSDEWTQHGFPGTFQSFVPAPWWIPPGLRRTCILPSKHIAPWCCSPGSHPWCNEPSVPPCKYPWILTHSWQNDGGDVFHVLRFHYLLPVHDDPMWDVHTFYVFLVVLRVREKIQAVSWPFIFYLEQKKGFQWTNHIHQLFSILTLFIVILTLKWYLQAFEPVTSTLTFTLPHQHQ